MPVYNKYSAVQLNKFTEIQVYGDGSINIEVDVGDTFAEVDLTLKQLKRLVKEAEARKALFDKFDKRRNHK